jgi:WD40 repeat protein
LAARTVAVPPLTADEMEQAIRTPAERADVSLDHGVVAEMIADVAHQPGALPLLQYSLTEMFDRREHDHITVADYEAVGRIAGALSSRADRIVDEADGTERRAIRQVLLRLVTLGEGREDTRRRVPLRELDRLGIDQEALTRVLDTFGRHRIMTFDRDPASREPTVEIAHEALLAAWARLRTWIDGAREDLRRERRLADATAAWLAEGRDPSFLMRGARLERTEDWLSTTDVGVGHDELAFVRASAEQRDREAAAERERAQREVRNEARARTRLRALVAVFAIAAVVAGSLTLVATDQRGRASTAAVVAQARELASAANASLEDDPELAVLLAAEAVERSRAATGEPDVEATQALHRAILASRIVATVPDVRGPIATSPDGTIAAQREAGAIVLFDGSGSPISTIDAHGGEITSMAFSPDGRRLVTTGTDGRLRVWDPSNGTLDWERRGAGEAWGATLDARGALVTARWPAAGVVVVSDAATGRPIRTLRGLDESSLVAISPDGGRIALSVGENRGVVFGRIISLRGTGGGVRFDAPPWQGINGPLDWSPDGRFLSGSSYVWDATTGERIHTVWNHDGLVGSSDWSPDAGRLVTGGWDGVTNIWSFEPELRPSLTLTARDIGVVAVTFTPDGDRVITASDAVRIWDVRPLGNAERASLALPTTFDGQIAFTPDGALIVNHDGGEGLLRWTIDEPGGVPVSSTRVAPSTAFDVNPVDGSIVQSNDDGTHSVLGEDGARRSTIETGPIEWAADGEHLAATPGTRTVALVEPDGTEVWRMQLPIDVGVLEVGTDGLIAVSGKDADPAPMTLILDAEGSIVATLPSHAIGLRFGAPGRIATIDERTQITEWDIASGRPVHTYPEDGPFAFSPDGITMAVMRGDAVRLYDTTTHEVVLELPSPDDTPGTEFCFADQLAFDPSGTLLAVRSCDGVRVWSLDIDDLLTIAAANVTRTLTDEECRRYLHTDGCT